jgi:superfamily II DNA/RNA helicase
LSPTKTFADIGVPAKIVELLKAQRIETPFPIQVGTIEAALDGRDVCAKAPTGSGKTLAFGIPLVARTTRARPRCPRALVLVPTRELAMQVSEVLSDLAKTADLRVATIYGGAGYRDQAKQIRHGCDIVVACVGRLGDLLERGDLMLKDVETVVLDEADRMSDMGFLPEVKKLISHIVVKHQFLLFSATLEGNVDKFVKQYLNNPFRFEVGADKHESKAVHLFWRADSDRVDVCARISQMSSSTIVFCRTKRGVDRLVSQLKSSGVKAVAIHGDRTQAQRTRALADFTNRRVRTLVATDVAARGLHIDSVDCVIHFDQPDDHTDYVHRSGRTARAGAQGTVISLVTGQQIKKARDVQRLLKMRNSITAPDWKSVSHLGTIAPAIRTKTFANKGSSSNETNGRNSKRRRNRSYRSNRGRPRARNSR